MLRVEAGQSVNRADCQEVIDEGTSLPACFRKGCHNRSVARHCLAPQIWPGEEYNIYGDSDTAT